MEARSLTLTQIKTKIGVGTHDPKWLALLAELASHGRGAPEGERNGLQVEPANRKAATSAATQ